MIKAVKSAKTPTSRYIISSKEDIVRVLFPIFAQKPFWVRHRYWQHQDLLFQYENDIVKYDSAPQTNLEQLIPGQTKEAMLMHPLFSDWLVGFIEAEGAFMVNPANGTAEFAISQTNNRVVLEAIREHLLVETQIRNDEGSEVVRTGSVKGIQAVLNVINRPGGARLQGFKKFQFEQWIKSLKAIPRFGNGLDFGGN